MADWAFIEGQRLAKAGDDTGNSGGTLITASGSTNTKGSYTQLIAATPFLAKGVLVEVNSPSAAAEFLFDIAIGAAASEVVIFSNLVAFRATGEVYRGHYYYFPVQIPTGVRLSARCQSTTGSATLRVSLLLMGLPFNASSPLASVLTIGANTADSGGVQIDPGATVNTKGAYSEMTASLTHPIRWLYVGLGNQVNITRVNESWFLDVAVGGAGSEVVIIPNQWFTTDTPTDALNPALLGPFPCSIKSGQRIAIRAQSDVNEAVDRVFDAIIYGVR